MADKDEELISAFFGEELAHLKSKTYSIEYITPEDFNSKLYCEMSPEEQAVEDARISALEKKWKDEECPTCGCDCGGV